MKTVNLSILFVLLSILIAGCAHMYKAPVMTSFSMEENLNGSKVELFMAARTVLVNEGFAIKYSDEDSGIIKTSFKPVKLDSKTANCGTTAGMPSLAAHRITGEIAVDLVIDDNTVNITSSVRGEDVRKKVADVTCVSTGTIEKDLIQKIQDRTGR